MLHKLHLRLRFFLAPVEQVDDARDNRPQGHPTGSTCQEGKERRNLNYSNNNINNIKISNNKINKNKHENENPILQIDVNLKHGMKKKVYVYEGDTAENLAIEFSEENGLDDKMRKKLQILIQQEIDKLLTKIEEESQSTFKSTNKLDN